MPGSWLTFWLTIMPCLCLWSIVLPTSPSRADIDVALAEGMVEFTFPGHEMEIAEKKPVVRIATGIPTSEENLLVLLDGVDITGTLKYSTNGFEYHPVEALGAGEHQLLITLYLPSGEEVEREFSFITHHQGFFNELTSDNNLSVAYEQLLKKSDELSEIPHRNLNANFSSISTSKKGPWQVGVRTNLRFLDRSAPVFYPEEKGIDLIDYLVTGQYVGETVRVLAETGDLSLQETQNTVMGLARRGARVGLGYQSAALNAFVVQSDQVYGFDSGTGLDFDEDDHIYGVSGEVGLFEDRLKLKTIYVDGGEEGSSFGIYTDGGLREGDVLGVVAQAQLLEGRLSIDGEYDIAEFDGDTSDKFGSETDRAWNVRASGYLDSFNYQALYEYVGPDYEVVGNQNLQRDLEGFNVMAGMNRDVHAINLSVARYEDNVDEDDLFPQVVSSMASIDYSLAKFPTLPMGLNYQKSILDTSMVPEFGFPLKTHTDVVGARINYLLDKWNFGFNVSYSKQDDKTPFDYDSSAQMYNLAPVYYSECFTFAPNLAFNRSTNETTDVDTDTYTITLDVRGSLFQQAVSYELAGTFNRMEMSDGGFEMETINSNARIAYHFLQEWTGFLNPTVGLRGLYNRTDDKVLDQDNDEFALLLAVSSSMGFSF